MNIKPTKCNDFLGVQLRLIALKSPQRGAKHFRETIFLSNLVKPRTMYNRVLVYLWEVRLKYAYTFVINMHQYVQVTKPIMK